MASLLNPYLNFRDTARQAMEFYQSVFGGELTVSTFGEFGMGEANDAALVMHAQLETPSGFTLMGADTPTGMDLDSGASITVCLSGDDVEQLRGYFAGLAEGGEVSVPLEKQMWGDEYGALVDRFGIPWMANISSPTV
jgi:PhnB protein